MAAIHPIFWLSLVVFEHPAVCDVNVIGQIDILGL